MGAIFRWIKELFMAEVSSLGKKVVRPTGTFPAAIAYNLFTVVGGNVAITSLVGEVTVPCGAGLNATLFSSDPTVGAAVDFDDGTADLNAAAAGTLIAPTGDVAVASALDQAVPLATTPMVCKPGVITLTMAAATLGAGSLRFVLHYIPIDRGAVVQAV